MTRQMFSSNLYIFATYPTGFISFKNLYRQIDMLENGWGGGTKLWTQIKEKDQWLCQCMSFEYSIVAFSFSHVIRERLISLPQHSVQLTKGMMTCERLSYAWNTAVSDWQWTVNIFNHRLFHTKPFAVRWESMHAPDQLELGNYRLDLLDAVDCYCGSNCSNKVQKTMPLPMSKLMIFLIYTAKTARFKKWTSKTKHFWQDSKVIFCLFWLVIGAII